MPLSLFSAHGCHSVWTFWSLVQYRVEGSSYFHVLPSLEGNLHLFLLPLPVAHTIPQLHLFPSFASTSYPTHVIFLFLFELSPLPSGDCGGGKSSRREKPLVILGENVIHMWHPTFLRRGKGKNPRPPHVWYNKMLSSTPACFSPVYIRPSHAHIWDAISLPLECLRKILETYTQGFQRYRAEDRRIIFGSLGFFAFIARKETSLGTVSRK